MINLLHNDLETVTVERYPLIEQVKRQLVQLGAKGALMSGSGSTVFGVFSDQDTAQAAADKMSCHDGWRAYAVKPI